MNLNDRKEVDMSEVSELTRAALDAAEVLENIGERRAAEKMLEIQKPRIRQANLDADRRALSDHEIGRLEKDARHAIDVAWNKAPGALVDWLDALRKDGRDERACLDMMAEHACRRFAAQIGRGG